MLALHFHFILSFVYFSALAQPVDIRSNSRVGLGNNADVFYSVLVKLGPKQLPYSLIADTGSSDLWVISDECRESCGTPKATFSTATGNLSSSSPGYFDIAYGTTTDSVYARGPIVSTSASLGSFQLNNQMISAVNDTSTNIASAGSSGILGLGFPTLSFIARSISNVSNAVGDWISNGPFITRLVLSGQLDVPAITIAMQRNTFEMGGLNGQMTIGSYPQNISTGQFNWIPVKLYTAEQAAVQSSSKELFYPITWEIPIDGVYLNGVLLPSSNQSTSQNSDVTALIDSANSFFRGPADVVDLIFTRMNIKAGSQVPCNTYIDLQVSIGGKRLAINPFDLLQSLDGIGRKCAVTISSAAIPSDIGGAGYSWWLGTQIYRSAVVAHYYGNITNPSKDIPKIGFIPVVDAQVSRAEFLAHFSDNAAYEYIDDDAPVSVFPARSTSDGIEYAFTDFLGHSSAQAAAAGRKVPNSSQASQISSTSKFTSLSHPTQVIAGVGGPAQYSSSTATHSSAPMSSSNLQTSQPTSTSTYDADSAATSMNYAYILSEWLCASVVFLMLI